MKVSNGSPTPSRRQDMTKEFKMKWRGIPYLWDCVVVSVQEIWGLWYMFVLKKAHFFISVLASIPPFKEPFLALLILTSSIRPCLCLSPCHPYFYHRITTFFRFPGDFVKLEQLAWWLHFSSCFMPLFLLLLLLIFPTLFCSWPFSQIPDFPGWPFDPYLWKDAVDDHRLRQQRKKLKSYVCFTSFLGFDCCLIGFFFEERNTLFLSFRFCFCFTLYVRMGEDPGSISVFWDRRSSLLD